MIHFYFTHNFKFNLLASSLQELKLNENQLIFELFGLDGFIYLSQYQVNFFSLSLYIRIVGWSGLVCLPISCCSAPQVLFYSRITGDSSYRCINTRICLDL